MNFPCDFPNRSTTLMGQYRTVCRQRNTFGKLATIDSSFDGGSLAKSILGNDSEYSERFFSMALFDSFSLSKFKLIDQKPANSK